MRATRQRTCRAHCRQCGGCFSSVAAFDAHLAGPLADRTHLDPSGVVEFELRPGRCREDGIDKPASIAGLILDRVKAELRFGKSPESVSEPGGQALQPTGHSATRDNRRRR